MGGEVAVWQPDECKLVNPVIQMACDRIPYNTNIYYPNQFVSKIAALFLRVYYDLGGTSDIAKSVESYFIFRLAVVVFSTATICVTFLIGNYIKEHLGVLLAGIVSIYPLYVCLAKQVTGDATTMFFLTLEILFALRYVKENHRELFLILMCMCAAMGTLEKWHGAMGIGYVGIVLIVGVSSAYEYVVKGIRAIGYYIGWILIFAPNVIIYLRQSIVDGFINIAVYDGADAPPYLSMLCLYIKYSYLHIFGAIGIAIFIVGIVCLIRTWNRLYFVIIIPGLIKVLILSIMNRGFERWGFEWYMSILFVISLGLYHMMTSKLIYLRSIACVGVTIFALSLLSASMVELVTAVTNSDTRLVQRNDCLGNGITPYNTISQYYTGFNAAGWCDKQYPDTTMYMIDWHDYFTVKDGKLYRVADNFDYVVMNKMLDAECIEVMDAHVQSILSYDAYCGDVFWNPIDSLEHHFNDFELIGENIDCIKAIRSGNMVGISIKVYDVTGIEVYDAK